MKTKKYLAHENYYCAIEDNREPEYYHRLLRHLCDKLLMVRDEFYDFELLEKISILESKVAKDIANRERVA